MPQLSDKIDMIPGHTNTLWLQADRAGEYRGQCAEFCGAQHALMAFVVIADPPDKYAGWIAQQQQTAPNPSDPQLVKGQQAFFNAACMYCHRIAGASASGKVGPDLTHIGSRDYLAAGTLKNTPGNLAGWITNPQSIKPNNQMPNFYLAPADLQALIAYLESLK
ncbi:MAG: c-type cytochrome [Thermomicrobiales bacterium]